MDNSEFGYSSTPKCTPERRSSCEQFVVEDLLDFSNDDGVAQDDVVFDDDHNNNGRDSNSNSNSNSSDSSNDVTPPGNGISSFSCNNNEAGFPVTGDIGSHSFSDTPFSGDLCVPYDDLAELEWLSNFVEESLSSEDLQKSHIVSGMSSATKTRPDPTIGSSENQYFGTNPSRLDTAPNPMFSPEMPVPGKARSKRSRAAPCNWTSRLKVLTTGSPEQIGLEPGPEMKPMKQPSKKKTGSGIRSHPSLGSGSGYGSWLENGEVRKCLHCATDKTPQWRTGPMGPKSLCNACGVRYKSGRLVPEYRPAASPTFIMAKHSNSHRKVMELRRQKEMTKQQQHIQQQQYHQQQHLIHHSNIPSNMIFDPANSDDYLIHQRIGPDFRQLT